MKYLLANWKMFPTVDESLALLHAIQDGLRERARLARPLPVPIVCPPFVSLVPLRAALDEHVVRLGAQNCHWEQSGPHTGEISPTMLKGIVDYVMVGHSERRATGETDEHVAKKVAAAAEAGLVPIFFVGEDQPGPEARSKSEHQLRRGLARTDVQTHGVVVVYEPRWAIGADRAADADYVQAVVEHLKARLRQEGVSEPEVIYGGTVNDDNIEQFAELEVLDGVGATRASLHADEFLAMIDRLTRDSADAHQGVAPEAARDFSSSEGRD